MFIDYTDIDECKLLKSDPETDGSKCVDTDGSYKVKCNFGRIGSKCRPVFSATVAAVSGEQKTSNNVLFFTPN